MIYLFSLIVVSLIGILILKLILKDKIPLELSLFLGTALGFGFVGQMVFYLQLIFNQFNPFVIPLVSLAVLGCLIWLNQDQKSTWHLFTCQKRCQAPFLILIIAALAIPLWLEAHYYPLGGWDAWSCWNLKAKFIYFGQEHWKNLFDPALWRSNTGYPLSLPTITVWFWQWSGFSADIPMFNTIVLTLLTAGVLLYALKSLNVPSLPAALITISIFTVPFGNTLFISQYSDILFSLNLLCAFVCFLMFHKTQNNSYLIVTAIFIGLLAFTKNEGLASCAILTVLILWQRLKNPFSFLCFVGLSALPMIIFTLWLAPHAQAFINGLFSADQPSSFLRLMTIFKNTFLEFVSVKWMGLWILAAVGLFLSKEKAFKAPLGMIGAFILCYLLIILGYYQINTFFDIQWWMDNSFHRIIFALMPCVYLWVGVSLFSASEEK